MPVGPVLSNIGCEGGACFLKRNKTSNFNGKGAREDFKKKFKKYVG